MHQRGAGLSGHSGGTWHVVRGLTRIIAAIVSTVLLCAVGYGWYNFHQLNAGLQRLTIAVGHKSGVAATHKDIDGTDQNLLVVGNDDRTGDTAAELKQLDTQADGGSLATDTMMIVHIPANGKKATLISLPRDSYVAIPGYGTHKLNSAYGDGYVYSAPANASSSIRRQYGANLLIQTIEQLTGLTIDHFVEVNLYGFYTISNAIGGVRVDLCQSQNDANSGFDQPAGWDTLVGTQALAFVRQRDGLPQGDLSRERRQQYFLAAAFQKIESAGVLLDPSKLSNLVSAVDGALYVDQNLSLSSLAEQMANLTSNNIRGAQMPTDGNIVTSDGDALAVNPVQVKAYMAAIIAAESATPARPSSASSATSQSPTPSATATATPSATASASPPNTGCIN